MTAARRLLAAGLAAALASAWVTLAGASGAPRGAGGSAPWPLPCAEQAPPGWGAATDHEGFALAGDGWRAFRSAAAGAAEEGAQGWVRLPEPFRRDLQGTPSRAMYRANLALLSAALRAGGGRADAAPPYEVEPLEEGPLGADLDGDGRVGGVVRRLASPPRTYLGAARRVALEPGRCPEGTEVARAVPIDATPCGLRPWLRRGRGGWVRLDMPDARSWAGAEGGDETCSACHAGGAAVDKLLALPNLLPGAEGWWPFPGPHAPPALARSAAPAPR